MCNGKIYRGKQYSFYREKEPFCQGGNGQIYNVSLVEPPDANEYVAKFFECKNYDRQLRYNRFKKEAEYVYSAKDINGILPIIDLYCPDSWFQGEEAWYLMPKAKEYKVAYRHKNLADKLDDMLRLACIIEGLHQRKVAHRDIKPENILIYNNQLVLSDFGLLWEYGKKRITHKGERLGPYRIMPPEFENIIGDEAIDYRASDVFLFAKVLWMTIKENNNGFTGHYDRGDTQIYLNKETYSESTFEPLHILLENATCQDPEQRISISQCIHYLQLQISLLNVNNPTQEQLAPFLYDEASKEFIAHAKPSEIIYDSNVNISKALSNLLPIASITILKDDGEEIAIIAPSISISTQKVVTLSSFVGRRLATKYCFCVKELKYYTKKEEIEVILDNLETIDAGFEPISNYSGLFSPHNKNYYLSSNERLLLRKSLHSFTT